MVRGTEQARASANIRRPQSRLPTMPVTAIVWIAALFAVALAVPMALFFVLRVPPQHRVDDLPAQWPLQPRPVFNPAERRLYQLLREALPNHVVLAKLPLVRVCQPSNVEPEQVRYWFRLLGAIHINFALCDPLGRVLAAVDLVPSRGAPTARAQRIKSAVLQACGVRYMTCAAESLPTLAQIRALMPPQPAELGKDSGLASAVRTALTESAGASPERRRFGAANQFDDSFFMPSGDSLHGELETAGAGAEDGHAGQRHPRE